jgi:hypothetical protein
MTSPITPIRILCLACGAINEAIVKEERDDKVYARCTECLVEEVRPREDVDTRGIG